MALAHARSLGAPELRPAIRQAAEHYSTRELGAQVYTWDAALTLYELEEDIEYFRVNAEQWADNPKLAECSLMIVGAYPSDNLLPWLAEHFTALPQTRDGFLLQEAVQRVEVAIANSRYFKSLTTDQDRLELLVPSIDAGLRPVTDGSRRDCNSGASPRALWARREFAAIADRDPSAVRDYFASLPDFGMGFDQDDEAAWKEAYRKHVAELLPANIRSQVWP
ncbi:MAG: hypothetical protein GY722_17865 [bacterium]|nr:hypothetical protein [bacterium]